MTLIHHGRQSSITKPSPRGLQPIKHVLCPETLPDLRQGPFTVTGNPVQSAQLSCPAVQSIIVMVIVLFCENDR